MRVIMPVIIDRAGRRFNADETDGVSRRHTRAGGQRGEPVVRLDWLSPGVHVTCYMPPFGELNRRIIQHGWLFVETRLNGIGYALQ